MISHLLFLGCAQSSLPAFLHNDSLLPMFQRGSCLDAFDVFAMLYVSHEKSHLPHREAKTQHTVFVFWKRDPVQTLCTQ